MNLTGNKVTVTWVMTSYFSEKLKQNKNVCVIAYISTWKYFPNFILMSGKQSIGFCIPKECSHLKMG